MAAAGVTVTGAGGFGAGTCPAVNPGDCRFFGTSAAAPHAAGCEALVRQSLLGAPLGLPGDHKTRLAGTATDLGAPLSDNTFGAGRLNCFGAAADRDANGDVNVADLGIIIGCFGLPTACDPLSDPNRDGVNNILDISFEAANFGL